MKHQYSYKINPPDLPDTQIQKYQDFDGLMHRYHRAQARPRRGSVVRWLAVAASLAAGIAFLIFFFSWERNSYQRSAQAYFANQPFINPPFPEVELPFATTIISAKSGGIIKQSNGTAYEVPKNAFVNEDGESVEGDVIIKYRELHDYVDFFVSGIPMTYDSAGRTYQFESAGMVEIFAEQEGKRLNLHPDKPIQVDLVSEIPLQAGQSLPKFNIYKLDTDERNWKYQEIDNIQLAEYLMDDAVSENNNLTQALQAIGIEENRAIAKLESQSPPPTEPVKPKKADGGNFVFDLDFKSEDILADNDLSPEESKALLRQVEGSLWQVKPGSDITSEDLKKAWTDAKITPLNEQEFELTLIDQQQELTVIVNAVRTGKQYQQALEQYEKQLESYIRAMKERELQLAPQIAAIRKKYDLQREQLQTENQSAIASTDDWTKVKVVNRFTVNSFGIWNCDRPYLPEGDVIEADFVDNNQNQYDHHTAYMVDKNRNTITRIYASKNCEIKYNDKSENLLWVVTPDNKIAVFRPEDFAKLNRQQEDDFTFVMNVVDQPIASVETVRQVLHF